MRYLALAFASLLAVVNSVAAADTTAIINGGMLKALLGGGKSGASIAAMPDLEQPAAINGTGYAIISQLFDGSSGSSSFVRLINANAGNTTFNVLVINTANGITLGSAAIVVPPYAAPQYAVTGTNSILSLAGVSPSAAANAALYIQDTDVGAGYAHVTFNGATSLFENQSTCTTPLNQRLTSQNRQMLANVHTTALAGNNYPSVIGIHNYSTAATSVRLTAYDATTGANLGNVIQTVAANGTLSLSENQFENLINFTPTASQLHINIIVAHSSGAAAPVTLTQTIRNLQLGGEINMGQVCAVNSLSATVTTPVPTQNAATAYCGTLTPPLATPYPYNVITYVVVVSVVPNGQVFGLIGGRDITTNTSDTAAFIGTANGNNFSITQGGTGSGSISTSGILTASFTSSYGVATVSASTARCAS